MLKAPRAETISCKDQSSAHDGHLTVADTHGRRLAHPLDRIDRVELSVERVALQPVRDDEDGLGREALEKLGHGRLARRVHAAHHLVQHEHVARYGGARLQ